MSRNQSLIIPFLIVSLISTTLFAPGIAAAQGGSTAYTIVDTGQTGCYDTSGTPITCPAEGTPLAGQDGAVLGSAPAYIDNGDGTVTDVNTGLMWQQSPGAKATWDAANAGASSLTLGGYTDWRLPTIKELYSLINFNGRAGMNASDSVPYLDTTYFAFSYGDVNAGERFIDAQYWSATQYTSTTMNGDATVFGVNFADGRIKGYPVNQPGPDGGANQLFVRYVRGNTAYGVNNFADNGNGTITDQATGLMWMQADSGMLGAGASGNGSLDWAEALAFCDGLDHAGYTDWRLPNAKALQSIVDYTRSLDATGTAAINPLFFATPVMTSDGQFNYPYYWTSTTHLDGANPGSYAVYVAFGEAQGYMETPPGSGTVQLLDVHGAGAQRSDPKAGNPADYPTGHGPQGDVIGIYNYARCVRDASGIATTTTTTTTTETTGTTETTDTTAPTTDPAATDTTMPETIVVDEFEDLDDLYVYDDIVWLAAMLGITEEELVWAMNELLWLSDELVEAAAILGISEEQLIEAAVALAWGADPVEVAAMLGITEEQLMAVVGDEMPVLATAIQTLNLDAESVIAALVYLSNPTPANVIAAAEVLGVTPEAIMAIASVAVAQEVPALMAAAEMLGITPEALLAAVGEPPYDFAAAAQALGINQDTIMAALEARAEGLPLAGQLDLAAAAQALGITQDDLMAALGGSLTGRPNFATAAQSLGISQEALMQALGVPSVPGGLPAGGQLPAPPQLPGRLGG